MEGGLPYEMVMGKGVGPDRGNDLESGHRYHFWLADGRSFEGKVRTLRYPAGYAGANSDGRHTVHVTGSFVEWFLTPEEIEAAEELG